jgi:hypothetical protein
MCLRTFVVPAKAGTQWRSLHNATVATTLDSRFRGNDSSQYLWRPSQTELVIPAKAGIHFVAVTSQWIPAFAGMTALNIVVPTEAGTTNSCWGECRELPLARHDRTGPRLLHSHRCQHFAYNSIRFPRRI